VCGVEKIKEELPSSMAKNEKIVNRLHFKLCYVEPLICIKMANTYTMLNFAPRNSKTCLKNAILRYAVLLPVYSTDVACSIIHPNKPRLLSIYAGRRSARYIIAFFYLHWFAIGESKGLFEKKASKFPFTSSHIAAKDSGVDSPVW
jgi:hypothetical protein